MPTNANAIPDGVRGGSHPLAVGGFEELLVAQAADGALLAVGFENSFTE